MNDRLRLVRRADVFTQPLDDELVLYDPGSGETHVLNPTAHRTWTLLDGTRSVAALARALAAEYGVSYARVRADLEALLDRLAAAGLLVGADGG